MLLLSTIRGDDIYQNTSNYGLWYLEQEVECCLRVPLDDKDSFVSDQRLIIDLQHFVWVCEGYDKNVNHDWKRESDDVITDWTFTDTPSTVVLFDGWVNPFHWDEKQDAADEVVDVDYDLND